MKKIFLMIPLLLILFTVPVRASTEFPTLPTDGNTGYVIFHYVNDDYEEYNLCTFNNNTLSIEDVNDSTKYDSKLVFNSDWNLYILKNGKWKFVNDYTCETGKLLKRDKLMYSSCNIVHKDTGNVVFPEAPIREPLAELVQRAKVGAIMEVVAKVVPAIMIVVVGLIGLRNALTLLKNIFRRA